MDILRVAGLNGMVTKLLENAVHLKTLHLESGCLDDDPQYLRSIFATMSRMRLGKITLNYIDLDRFNPLKDRIESLRHLQLVDYKTNRSLKKVLFSIQKNLPRLEQLLLFENWGCKEVKFRGIQGVSDGIDKLMQSRLNHHNNPGWAALWDSDQN